MRSVPLVTRARALLAIVLAVSAVVAATSVRPVAAATGSTVVGATIPSATSISATGCPALTSGITDFGSVTAGSSVVTSADCEVQFGSSNDTSMLRLYQGDGGGDAMVPGPTSATLGYWPFNGDGRDLSPVSRTATTAAAPGDPAYVAGSTGHDQALDFDASDSALAASSATWDVTSYTVDAWVFVRNVNAVIVAREAAACSNGQLCQMEMFVNATGHVGIEFVTGVTWHGTYSTTDIRGAWHHVAATVDDATKVARIYVDGVLEATDTTWSSGSPYTGVANPISFGQTTSGIAPLDGSIDEVRFQAGARSDADIRQYATARVRDYGGAGALWGGAVTSGLFGGCLSSVLDGAATDGTTWTPNAGCPVADASHWKPIVATGGTTGSKLATAPSGDIDAKVRLRFG
jgi:hypothetical protein